MESDCRVSCYVKQSHSFAFYVYAMQFLELIQATSQIEPYNIY